ncbi:MAG: hypothetical protein AB8B53_15010 [Flavobacteriales bacterium]
MRLVFFLITGIPILLAGLIYLTCREGSLLINLIVEELAGGKLLESFKSLVSQTFKFSEASVSSLPSALWVFSTAMLSSRIQIKKKALWYLMFISPLLYSVSLEVLQYYHITDGTFDRVDLTYSVYGWLGAACVAKLYDLLPSSIHLNLSSVVCCYFILVLGNVY